MDNVNIVVWEKWKLNLWGENVSAVLNGVNDLH